MIQITLPDGSVRPLEAGQSALDLAKAISPNLARATLAAKVDGEVRDATFPLTRDCAVKLLTWDDPDGRHAFWHSSAHLMAEALEALYPGAKFGVGPALENGFYYDVDFGGRAFSAADFEKVEAKMKEIARGDHPYRREDVSKAQALDFFGKKEDPYKVDLIQGFEDGTITFYRQNGFTDLCRGPHLPHTGFIRAVKLLSVAGAYWKGDEKNAQLTRIYGITFPKQKELDEWLVAQEEAKKRDHRKIGKDLKLFHIDDEVGQGLVLWTPAGSVVRQELQTYISGELSKQGYSQVFTPHIGKLSLYKTSGHFPYYKESQFPPIVAPESLAAAMGENCSCSELIHRIEAVSAKLASGVNERSGSEVIGAERVLPDDKLLDGFLLKPMNCPHHIKIFASQPRSYRDLPVRLAEFGTVYRWEQSGELTGMTRVRGFTQDDAHLFCTEEQVPAEILGCLSLVRTVLTTLGMSQYRVRVGLRDPDSAKYTGLPENWDKAERACRDAAQTLGVPFTEEPGEAAFYGPKIDFVVKDVLGREWQLGTVQVDYNLPIRFDLSYNGADNQPHRPVMIHRAPFGSLERFCGVLIEHFAGRFPFWLSPQQVRVLTVNEAFGAYGKALVARLSAAGLRAELDERGESLGKRVRDAQLDQVPAILTLGKREEDEKTVSVRLLSGEQVHGVPLESFIQQCVELHRGRALETRFAAS
ncbi:MAG: threonine--tRNA ligase [Spirochaetes bacterium]|nr:threonine--tRNA ligase [Spirochaetota bacterium]